MASVRIAVAVVFLSLGTAVAGVGLQGLRGLADCLDASNEGTGTLSVALHGLYTNQDSVGFNRSHRGQARLSVAYALAKVLELGAFVPYQFSYLSGQEEGEEEGELQTGFGDLEASGKFTFPLGSSVPFRLGVLGFYQFTTGDQEKGFGGLKATKGAHALLTLDLSGLPGAAPLVLHGNVGVRKVSSADSLRGSGDITRLAVALELPTPDMAFFVEGVTDQRSGAEGLGFSDYPIWVTPGVRFGGVGTPHLTLAVRIGLNPDDAAFPAPDWEAVLTLASVSRMAPRDRDGDGVADENDMCPQTPSGALVDARGCPLDSDWDGVPDGIDRCPGTPQGAVVDRWGCPQDSDGDGVPDGVDRCPGSPPGVSVDRWGCAQDSDGDGIPDGVDKCPGTFPRAVVDEYGCPTDEDSDGVADGVDRCPGTPYGAKVDSFGCPTDSDGDGVMDGLDRCPDTPYGAVVDQHGCPLDEDKDGVPDGVDLCPQTPYGAVVDRNGCPLDTDGDGVFDGLDKCPGTRPGVKVNKWGCPERTRLEGVNFAYNSAELLPESFPVLDKAGQLLVDVPEMRVRIEGHTDSDGSETYNLSLSQRRAEAVRNYLISKFGIDPARIQARGLGESSPIASNDTPEGKALNRRVEFVILE